MIVPSCHGCPSSNKQQQCSCACVCATLGAAHQVGTMLLQGVGGQVDTFIAERYSPHQIARHQMQALASAARPF
jgi:hypothetical protein